MPLLFYIRSRSEKNDGYKNEPVISKTLSRAAEGSRDIARIIGLDKRACSNSQHVPVDTASSARPSGFMNALAARTQAADLNVIADKAFTTPSEQTPCADSFGYA